MFVLVRLTSFLRAFAVNGSISLTESQLYGTPTRSRTLLSISSAMQWKSLLTLALVAPHARALLRFGCSQLVTERLDP